MFSRETELFIQSRYHVIEMCWVDRGGERSNFFMNTIVTACQRLMTFNL